MIIFLNIIITFTKTKQNERKIYESIFIKYYEGFIPNEFKETRTKWTDNYNSRSNKYFVKNKNR